MKFVIAEKTSVAQSLSKVISAIKRQNGCLKGGGYLVKCVGSRPKKVGSILFTFDT